MGKEVKERSSNSNTLASQPNPAAILPSTLGPANLTVPERREFVWGLVSDVEHLDLLFLANIASAVISPEVAAAPEESSSSTGRIEKHACKQRGAGGEGSGLPKNLWRKRELVVQQAAHVEEAKHPSNGCREDRRFGKTYVRRKNRKEHMDFTSTNLELVQKSSSKGIYNNAVLGPDVPGGEMIVSDTSNCNQWWNFKTRPGTSRGTRRHVQWRNKRKRNCMAFEEIQRNRKILLLAAEAITHQLGLLDVSMEEKGSYK